MIPFWALILLAGSAVVAILLMLAARRYVASSRAETGASGWARQPFHPAKAEEDA